MANGQVFDMNDLTTTACNIYPLGTWLRMIESLVQYTPTECAACGGAMTSSMGFRMKCSQCGQEITLRSGEELNREWVREYYDREYRPRVDAAVSATVGE